MLQGRISHAASGAAPISYRVLKPHEQAARDAETNKLIDQFRAKKNASKGRKFKPRPQSAAAPVKKSEYSEDYVRQLEEKLAALSTTNGLDDQILDRIATLKREQEDNVRAMERMFQEKQAVEKRMRNLEQRVSASPPRRSLSQKYHASKRSNQGDESLPPGYESPEKTKSPKWAEKRSFSFENKGIRRSAYHEEKEKERKEQERIERENEMRRKRALRAKAPEGIIQRGEESKRKREELIRQREEEERNMPKTYRFKARDPPAFSSQSESEIEREQLRKARIMKRAAENMAASKLPPRMEMSHKAQVKSPRGTVIQEQKKTWKPKAVPNFDKLHSQWSNALKEARTVHKGTIPEEFQAAKPERTTDMKQKKIQREERKQAEIEHELNQKRERSKKAYERALKSQPKNPPKQTKAQVLRSETVQKALIEKQKKEQEEKIVQKERQARLKKLGKMITPEIKKLDKKRKEEYQGNFVELAAAGTNAKQKAKENNRAFKEAIKKNKDRLSKALDNRPTLLQRYTIEQKTEEGKKNALASVVANVFGSKLSNIEGVFTDEEQDLVRAVGALKGKGSTAYDDDFE